MFFFPEEGGSRAQNLCYIRDPQKKTEAEGPERGALHIFLRPDSVLTGLERDVEGP